MTIIVATMSFTIFILLYKKLTKHLVYIRQSSVVYQPILLTGRVVDTLMLLMVVFDNGKLYLLQCKVHSGRNCFVHIYLQSVI